jgi:UDPglucose 6-dehydrogenase
MKSVLIVGYGTVGHNLEAEIKKVKPHIYDKYKTQSNTKENKKYDFAFICVDTPYISEEVPCDTKEVINAIKENDATIYVIKSTVPVGFTQKISKQLNKIVVFSPEYYGGTQHANNHTFGFTIIGGHKAAATELVQLLQNVYDGRHKFSISEDARLAELAKYMENSWLAYKVSFMVQFWEVCQTIGLNYEELRELFLLDPRVNPSHTFVYKDHPYWSSHCLNKDVPAVAYQFNMKLLKEMMNYNKNIKEKFIK